MLRIKFGLLSCLILFLSALTLPFSVFAKEPIRVLSGTVFKVTDGDTIQVVSQGTKLKIRLYGIDAPEMEHGQMARRHR